VEAVRIKPFGAVGPIISNESAQKLSQTGPTAQKGLYNNSYLLFMIGFFQKKSVLGFIIYQNSNLPSFGVMITILIKKFYRRPLVWR
jgi:hypothetical protein